VFYAPTFGTRQGAFISIIASLIITIGWFLMGNPYGIDNAYIALATPLVIMTLSHLLRGGKPEHADSASPISTSATGS
jgi:SSS family solute:Na+ symporter